jgi:hypothetical protein
MEYSSCNEFEVNKMGPFNKLIKEIIVQSETYLVYMDHDGTIQWATIGINMPDGAGEIINKVSDWEFKVNSLFAKTEAYNIKTILAEGYARLFADQSIILARDVVDRAIETITVKGSDILKQYYAFSATLFTILSALGILLTKLNKSLVIDTFGRDEYNIWLTMLFGGIGAYVFTTIRARDYKANIIIGKWVHALDGALRIFYGVIAGLIVSIAIKSNLALGFFNRADKGIYVMLFVGICAGASDLFIPNIIRQIERKSSVTENKTPVKSKTIGTK